MNPDVPTPVPPAPSTLKAVGDTISSWLRRRADDADKLGEAVLTDAEKAAQGLAGTVSKDATAMLTAIEANLPTLKTEILTKIEPIIDAELAAFLAKAAAAAGVTLT